MKKILFVCGDWNLENGKKSGLMDKIYKSIDGFNVKYHNGGNYNELQEILESANNFDYIFWFANVSNEFEKVRNVKQYAPTKMLVTSKRNNKEYSIQEIVAKSLQSKSNLNIEFDTTENPFVFRLTDPLANTFYNGSDVSELVSIMLNRLELLSSITRVKTIQNDIDEYCQEDISDEFLNVIKSYSTKFTSIIQPANSTRFLGNASFRCTKGFPSIRTNNGILVSRRNVNKQTIMSDDFVFVYDDMNYHGENKPSVDTPIQYELYRHLPDVKYMIHSHVYAKNAPFTESILPCGAFEEVKEILDVVNKNSLKSNFCINLLGHGCTVFASDLEYFKTVEFYERF